MIHRNIPREVDKFSEIASICSVSASVLCSVLTFQTPTLAMEC